MKTFNQMNIFFNGDKTPQINKAIEIFTDEIKRRSTIKIHQTTNLKINQTETILVTLEETDIQIEDKDLKLDQHTETEDLAPLSTEGYRIFTHATKSMILVTGKDERGVLFGLGKLIRNFEIFPDALIANKINKIRDIPFAYFFSLGNLFLMPLARIAPCKNPIAKTIPNVIRKFSSAICKISKLITIQIKLSFLKTSYNFLTHTC